MCGPCCIPAWITPSATKNSTRCAGSWCRSAPSPPDVAFGVHHRCTRPARDAQVRGTRVMPRPLIVAAVLVVLLAHTSSAQGDWVFGAFLGVAATADASLRIEQPAVGTNVIARNVSFAGRAFESPLYYGYRMMWAGPRRHRVGVEAELIHLKVY